MQYLLLWLLQLLIMMAEAALQLKNTRILVTGAGRGIGRAIAQICHNEGARVAVTARSESELRETASEPERYLKFLVI
jgi:NAD(P)-dependent dehydrogenase (short-subunit alcohol dehydrogenase family)